MPTAGAGAEPGRAVHGAAASDSASYAQHHPSDVPCGTRTRVLVSPRVGVPK